MIPSTNITTTMVGNELGISSRDVGKLCTSNKINIFSKFKPVKQPHPSVDSITNWWKGSNGNYGIILPLQISTLPVIGSPMALWRHDAPSGQTFPYRLGDFRGYDHNAVESIFTMYTDPTMYPGQSFNVSIGVSADSQIPFNDIADIRTSYIGVIIRHLDGSVVVKTLSNMVYELSLNEYSITVDIPSWSTGSIDIYMIASAIMIPTQASIVSFLFISLNLSAQETAHSIMQITRPLPDTFSTDYDIEEQIPGIYNITYTITVTRGSFTIRDITMFTASDPDLAIAPIGTVTNNADAGMILGPGGTYSFGHTVFKSGQDAAYLNVAPTYRGSIYGGFSIWIE